MKKMMSLLLVMMAALSLIACGKSDRQESGSKQTEQDGDGTKKILVAYFSWVDNPVQDDIDAMTSPSVTVPGNVAQLASWIGEETEGELFLIQVKEPYSSGRADCLNRANKEKGDGTHPALKAKVENLEDYDTIYLGYALV